MTWHSWSFKLQTQVVLSMTQAEYIALSQSLWDSIPFMELVNELSVLDLMCWIMHRRCIVRVLRTTQKLWALELAKISKMRPRTNRINVCYHHFCKTAGQGKITFAHDLTRTQRAVNLTKPLSLTIECVCATAHYEYGKVNGQQATHFWVMCLRGSMTLWCICASY